MSGMAGNVSAFTTVWTYDIYRALIKKDASDQHYVSMGRWSTVVGVAISIGTAYLVMDFKSIMDYVQALFSFFIAPLFATVILGMLWKRATPAGGFWGLLAGTGSSVGMWAWVKMDPDRASLRGALAVRARHGGKHVPRAVVLPHLRLCHCRRQSWSPSRNRTRNSRVWSTASPTFHRKATSPRLHRPWFWAVVVGAIFVALNIIFW